MMDRNEMAGNNHSLPAFSTYVYKEATGDHHPTIIALIIEISGSRCGLFWS